MSDEKSGKLDAKNTIYLLFGYYKGTRAYILICLRTNKIIKSKDVLLMDDTTSVGNYLKIGPSERHEALMVVRLDESSKTSSINLSDNMRNVMNMWEIMKLQLKKKQEKDHETKKRLLTLPHEDIYSDEI